MWLFKFDKAAAEQAVQRMRELAVVFPRSLGAAVFTAMNDVITEAAALAPRDTGALEASRYVTRTFPVVRGGFSALHAAVVHELPPHIKKHPTGQWKFLEEPLNRTFVDLLPRLVTLTREYAARGVTIDNVLAQHPETAPAVPRSGRKTSAVRLRLRPKGRNAWRSSGRSTKTAGRRRER